METKFEKLGQFFEKIKTISFWQRIFGWRHIRNLSYDAYKEFMELNNSLNLLNREVEQSKSSNAILSNDNEHLKEDKIKLEKEIISLKEKENQFSKEVERLKQDNTIYEQNESNRKEKYDKEAATLTTIREQIQGDRQKEQDEHHRKEIARLESMKKTWSKHEERVQNNIKIICQRHTIDYVDKVPFKGNPDNTIKICDEFVIFDAKSPSSDDLENFPIYIKSQTESVKKYIKQENVRQDIFLVIPSNTVDVLEQFSYNMGDYNVFIVTLDVLEPLILSLKKIEDYEFVEQLTPDERENICRVIGKFAHMTKRRIQIDHFFTREFLAILTKCEDYLPSEILDKVIEFEKSEKLNPPQERRFKQILTKELESDDEKIQKQTKSLPLYDEQESNVAEPSTDSENS